MADPDHPHHHGHVHLDLVRPGLSDRLDRAGGKWFADMRKGLTGCSVLHRPDVFVASSRQILIARPRP